MAKATRKRATRRRSLPDEIVVGEILVRLPPKSLLRCRSVCRAWRRATSARDFLLAHHARQPSLPILSGDNLWILGVHHHNILAFDSRPPTEDDQLHAVAKLDEAFRPEASCDGLLLLSQVASCGSRLSICNPATREHALLGPPWDFQIMGMYLHRPTGEHRLLLQRRRCNVADLSHKDQIGCYVFSLGSGQPPRYIGCPEMASVNLGVPVRLRDSLHWYPVYYQTEQNEWKTKLMVFDTVAESFRQMREPIVSGNSEIFEMDGMLGIYTRNYSTNVIDIRVLQNYESEVWVLKYQIELPVAEMRREFGDYDDYRDLDVNKDCDDNSDSDVEDCWDLYLEECDDRWDLDVVSVDSGVLLLVNYSGWLLHFNSDGKLVNSFYRGRRGLNMSMSGCRLKESLVRHTFFPALEGYAVNTSPFIGPVY